MAKSRAVKTTRRVGAASSIQSVERATEILNFFTVDRPQLSLPEITARLGLSKATAHRYVTVLRKTNLLRWDTATGVYTLGPQVLTLSAAARAGLPIVTVAGPFMEELVRKVNETTVLSVWDGEAPVVVRADDNAARVHRISVRAGARLSTVDSAQGRVFCAFLTPKEVPGLEGLLGGSETLRRDIEWTREHGVAFNTPELTGIRSIAAPVMDGGQIAAVLAVVGTVTSIPAERDSAMVRELVDMASRLSSEWGEA